MKISYILAGVMLAATLTSGCAGIEIQESTYKGVLVSITPAEPDRINGTTINEKFMLTFDDGMTFLVNAKPYQIGKSYQVITYGNVSTVQDIE